MFRKKSLPIPVSVSVPLAISMLVLAACSGSNGHQPTTATASLSAQDALATATPIKHVVVVFGENVSFDHYFGTYPNAKNPSGEPAFTAAAGTPTVDGLTTTLLTNSPTKNNTKNGVNAVDSFRLDRTQANTEDQTHSYTPEQLASDSGAMDLFPLYTGNNTVSSTGTYGVAGEVMGYFDGNTVTGLWNYAQNYALNDNAYTDSFGPSTPGAVSVISGTNNGAVTILGTASTISDGAGGETLIGDTDPAYDTCSSKTSTVKMTSQNIGDLLNAKNITWGGFMGGFDLTATNTNGTTGCLRTSYSSVLGQSEPDYNAHHAWFQYYSTTSNPAHTRPTSTAYVGQTDPKDNTATPVHHQYDVNDFYAAVTAGNFPSVAYIKAPEIGDAHPGNSDPLDEQTFVTQLVNFIMKQPDWKSTAIIVTYDDSDGWFDHRYTLPTTSSFDATTSETVATGTVTGADQLNSAGVCNSADATPGVGVNGGQVNGRCGPGTRIPLLIISPYAKKNYVDDTLVTQASVVRFIEDNWLGGTRIGQGSGDAAAGSLLNMFDFSQSVTSPRTVLLNTDGTVASSS